MSRTGERIRGLIGGVKMGRVPFRTLLLLLVSACVTAYPRPIFFLGPRG